MIFFICEHPNNKEAIANAEKWLVENGHQVLGFEAKETTKISHEMFMEIRIKFIELCDAVMMLHGWQESKDRRVELAVAKVLGKRVIYQDYYGRNIRKNEEKERELNGTTDIF